MALRIPKSLAVETHIEEGSTVEMTLGKDRIILKPQKKQLALEDILSKIMPDNLHGEINFGKPEGNELW